MRALEIAVVGCGSAGPAAAIMLQRAGHRVCMFEAVTELGPVGAGVLLQPTGLEVLARLGALEPVLAHGARVDLLVCRTRAGAAVLDLAYGELGAGVCGVGIHRAVLLHYLVEGVRAAEIPIHMDTAIVDVEAAGADTWRLRDRRGQEHGPFELVLVCDGARSALRERLAPRARAVPYPWGALWFIGRDPERRFGGSLSQTVHGARRMVGLLPTGLDLAGEEPLVSLFYSARLQAVDAIKGAGLAAWKADVLDLVPAAEPVVDQIDDFDQLPVAAYFDVRMRPWHHGQVLFMGDAAHATSPQLGQGVNLALCDAAALVDSLADADTIAAALDAYTRRRRVQVDHYQRASRWLTPFFQSSSGLLGWVRDWSMGAMTRIGPLRRKMTRTMAGVERGFLRPGLPLPAGAGGYTKLTAG
ncbi:FAD-dependent oxidoreductase [Haliangium sp.]|uniref:FAD-dependent oxidoreductase n=1 Tax=Haliangium sp. TaxID=2663208 RepID=UPI003D116FD1